MDKNAFNDQIIGPVDDKNAISKYLDKGIFDHVKGYERGENAPSHL